MPSQNRFHLRPVGGGIKGNLLLLHGVPCREREGVGLGIFLNIARRPSVSPEKNGSL